MQPLLALIPWVTVPVVLLALLLFARTIVLRTKGAELRASARAGFWAGLVVTVIFIVAQLRDIREPQFDLAAVPDFNMLSVLTGLALGFGLLWFIRYLLPTRMVGVTTLVLSAASTSALYGFIFIESSRAAVLYLALGVALGVLVHIVFFPASLKQLWAPASS